MDNVTRGALYLRDRSDLTPAQRRRFDKHAAIEEFVKVRRKSRLRKAWERKLNREVRDNAQVLIATIRASQRGGRRSTARRLFHRLLRAK